MTVSSLHQLAISLISPGKGLLAADESTGTIAKRLAAIGVESTEETRRTYRELLFTTPGAARYISGAILYDETIRQRASTGERFTELLERQGIVVGIKVDNGTSPLAACPGETVTEGLDGLRARLAEYRGLGASFTKWRGVFSIGSDPSGAPALPTETSTRVNAHALARYAALAQEAGLVPIVEPEVLMDGNHSLERAYEVSVTVQRAVFAELEAQRVDLTGMLLKPNMVLAGYDSPSQPAPEAVAERTLSCLRETTPAAVPGIVFLSGGQSDEHATANLAAIADEPSPKPWALSFSYGRALQTAALAAWQGLPQNVPAAQAAYLERARQTSAATSGEHRSC